MTLIKQILEPKQRGMRYQRALSTTTPGVGRRAGSTDGTNAVYIPSGDVVSFGRGNQVAGNFYQRFDGTQGTIVVKLTMEKASTYFTGSSLALEANEGAYRIRYSGATQQWDFTAGTKSVYVNDTWAQGDVRILIGRWDTKKTLDGTNYLCLTINDANSFGSATTPTASAPATFWIGSNNSTARFPALYEGFTICRRVLYDGTYGVQPSDGDYAADELAAIYNAGAFRDPARVVPIEDIVFQLAPLASSGALTTTNEAWSFPHSSDLGDEPFLTKGFYGGAANAVSFGRYSGATAALTNGFDSLAADATIEGWIRTDPIVNSTYTILIKGVPNTTGWYLTVNDSNRLRLNVKDGAASATVSVGALLFGWNHVAIEYTSATKTFATYINGVVANGLVLTTGHVDDSATGLQLKGPDDPGLLRWGFGWLRISNNIRYGAAFTPARACPANDGNTLALYANNAGTGTTLADTSSNVNHCTTSGLQWIQPWELEGTPSAVAVTAAANRVYAGGLNFTAAAPNDGIKQTIPCAAGADVWVSAWMHSDADGQPALVLWDADNAAELGRVESGAAGTYDDPDTPWRAELTTEAPAGCTHIEVRCINLAAIGTVYVHQCLVHANLLSNPSFEAAGAGGADVFANWSDNAGAGSIVDETTIVRSGPHAAKLTSGATGDTQEIQIVSATSLNSYYIAVHSRGDGATIGRYSVYDNSGPALVSWTNLAASMVWALSSRVFRAISTSIYVYLQSQRLASGAITYFDDISLIALDSPTLTVTPAAASSLINGADMAVRTLSGQLGASYGQVEFWVTPTWSAALAARGQTQETLLYLYRDANNYMRLSRTVNTLILVYNAQGAGVQTATFNLTGLWAADVRKRVELVYRPNGAFVLLDGVMVCVIAAACVFVGPFTTIYFGSAANGVNNADALFE